MALFHLESKFHSKTTKSGNAKSVSSIVAYRHCFAFGDFDYSQKSGFVTSFMLFPEDVVNSALKNLEGPNFSKLLSEATPEQLEVLKAQVTQSIQNGNVKNFWKAVEAKEKRKDAQLCEELIISLQHELSIEENIKNLKELINTNYISRGLAADICLHNPGDNLHAHVLITQRPVTSIGMDIEGQPVYEFGNKLRDQHFSIHGKMDQITPIREQWANLCNASFEAAGLDLSISHETLAKQREKAIEAGNEMLAAELDREPVKHIFMENAEILAMKAKQVERRNEEIEKMNQTAIELGLEIEPTPLLEVPARTFKGLIEQRKQNRIKEITENVVRYIKNRANKYSSVISEARNRAASVASTVAAAIRDKKLRMVNQITSNNFAAARDHVREIEVFGNLKRKQLESARRNQENALAEKTQRLLNDIEIELKTQVEKKPATKRQLWFDYSIQRQYKPDWAK
ncbi:MobA/MobL family protein [[Pasteurella] aerogenes]